MNPKPPSERSRLLALAATALALRLACLGRADLWTDEIQTLHAVQLDWGALVAERLRAGHVPVFFLVEKAWCAAFGTSQFALRMPAALFGAAMTAPAWSLLRRLVGARAAWWGAALVVVHPLFVELSREARMYSALGLAALVVADRAVAALDGAAPDAAFWTAVVVGPFVHPTWAFAVIPLGAWLLFERRAASPEGRTATKRVFVAVAASVAVLLVAMAFATPQRQTLTRRAWPAEAAVFVLRIFAGTDLRLLKGVGVVAFGLAWTTTLVVGWTEASPRTRRFALALGLGVPALSLAAGVAGGLPWGPARYLESAAVGAAALAACGFATTRFRPWTLLPLAASAALVATSVVSPQTAWSDAARALGGGLVVVDDESQRIVLSHYYAGQVVVGSPPPGATTWRRARLVVAYGRRGVEIEDWPPRR